MWAGESPGATAAGEAAGHVYRTDAAVPLPVVSNVHGWAVSESILRLLRRAQDIAEHPKPSQKVLDLLRCDGFRKAVHALDQLTDLPEYGAYRPDYARVCDALEDAEVLLLQHPSQALSESHLRRASRFLPERVMQSGKPKDVLATLQPFCEGEKYTQLFATMLAMPRPAAGRPLSTYIQRATHLPSLQPCYGASQGVAQDTGPQLPAHIFKHGDDLVPRLDKLLTTTRNIGIVGMGGIGKTTIARAVFERAKPRFDSAVWLTAGRDARDMLPLLETAFAKLYPGCLPPFSTAEEALSQLAHRLHQEDRSVLLVLDDVWLSSETAVLAALNFATCPQVQVNGSRLIVTTRDRNTMSYDPCSFDGMLMDELQIVEPALLDESSAQQLFHHHAFGASDATPPAFVPASTCMQLVRSCRGNPLAVQLLGSTMRCINTAEEWERWLASQREQQESGEDVATRTCAFSVDALPPSLRECFMDFAAFPEDAEVEEAHLLHLFATHAPLYSAASLRASAAKLDQLVSRSLVSKSVTSGVTVYRMHGTLRSIAVQLSHKPESARSFCGCRSGPPDSVRYFSSHFETVQQAEEMADQRMFGHMRACIIGEAPPPWRGLRTLPCIPRMQYLWLRPAKFEGHDFWKQVSAKLPMLRFLRLQCDASWLPESLIAGQQLVHLDLCGCKFLEHLPEGISECSQLAHLDLSGCQCLKELPEGISGCSQLAHLDLSGCQGLKQLPEGISGCSQLTNLNLADCSSLQALPEGISGCHQLKNLDLTGCLGLEKLPEGVSGCIQLPNSRTSSP